MQADFLSEKLAYPANLAEGEEPFFRPYLQWHLQSPQIISRRFLIVYNNAISCSYRLERLPELDPSDDYHKKINRLFFAGKLLKSILKGKFGFVKRPIYYCLNDYSNNYFHWFTEVLPKMLFAYQETKDPEFYIPFRLADYQVLSLKACKIRYRQADHAVTCLLRAKTIGKFSAMGCYHATSLATLRSQILSSVPRAEYPKRIYITRKNASRRFVLNEEQVCEIMEKHGFEVVDFDQLDFYSQVQISRSASIMVSLHGAALTNMIFMEPGSTVLEFLPRNEKDDKCYFTLAGTMKLKYYYLACEIDGPSYVFSNYQVDTVMLESVLHCIHSISPK